jgi:hypothetical protein
VVTGSDDTFQELVEKRIPIVIETVADYFPTELLDSYEETILWYLAGGYSGGLLLVVLMGGLRQRARFISNRVTAMMM